MDTKLLETIIKHVEEGNYKTVVIIVLFLIVLSFVFKFKDFLEYWSNKQNFRRKLLDEIINKTQKSEIKNFLEDELIREYFVRVFKFNAEVVFIEKLINFHKFLNGEFTFNQIIKSYRYIKLKDGKLSINISIIDWIFDAFIYYILASILLLIWVLMLCTLAAIVLKFVPWQYGLHGLLLLLMAIIILLILSVFVLVQATPYQNAKKLKFKLEKLNNQQLDYHI
jgi:hypothetical protein